MVRPSGRSGRRGNTMIVMLGAAFIIFIYLVFALINPERF
ncbi:K(+)-transporting ATPase subunit F [Paenibacillus cellulosilyticus]|nr:K(+)-transporting ATPase subunit F [Paenibacillus cellulosilyticus]